MAINSIKFITSPSATATNGSDIITITGNADCRNVYSGSAVFLGTRHVVEAVSGTAPDVSGNSTIKLRTPWSDPTTTANLTVFNTIEGLAEAIRRAREIVEGAVTINDALLPLAELQTLGFIERTGANQFATFSATAAGKALLGAATAADQRTALGLGTAAVANVTTSATDTTAGRLLKVGDFGLGGLAPIDNTYLWSNTRFKAWNSTAPDRPLNDVVSVGLDIGYAENRRGQLAITMTNRIFFRGVQVAPNDTSNWRELYHTGNTGTAVTANVTTSPTDTTVGRLLKVGDGGLLSIIQNWPTDDLNDDVSVGTSFHYTSIANNRPTSAGWVRYQKRNNDFATQEWLSATSPFNKLYRVKVSGVWGAWREDYSTANILGTVSQSAGVPTGAIIQRGSNANGEFVRFADGTMVCQISRTVSVTTSALGNIHSNISAFGSWTFPAAFSAAPNVSVAWNGTAVWGGSEGITATSANIITVFCGVALSNTNLTGRALAVGRWF